MKKLERIVNYLSYVGVFVCFLYVVWEYKGGPAETWRDHPYIFLSISIPTVLLAVVALCIRWTLKRKQGK